MKICDGHPTVTVIELKLKVSPLTFSPSSKERKEERKEQKKKVRKVEGKKGMKEVLT